jgi:hypothetical protein
MFSFNTPHWDHLRACYEAWWQGDLLDHPLVRITAPSAPLPPDSAPSDPAALFDWFMDPALVLPRLERRIASICYAGAAFPIVDPVSTNLAAIQAAYLGAPYTIVPGSLTGWADPILDDWTTRPPLTVDENNPWWRATRTLLDAAARQLGDRCAICIPDIQGGGEILALLRGTERLAIDLVDNPECIDPALQEIDAAWHTYFTTCYEIIHRYQPGYVDWLGIWSDRPAVTVECDFNVMISPRMFKRHFLPIIAQQAARVERSCFHLDGPGAIPHLDALLALPALQGIQWVPTPDNPRPTAWIPLLQRIQAGGKRVIVDCLPSEVLPLLQALDPHKLLLATACSTPAEADALAAQVRNH